jgi:hypothetical protein
MIDKLLELAEKATQGERMDDAWVGSDPYDEPDLPFVEIGVAKWSPDRVDVPAAFQAHADAAYIAAANPQAIKELCEELIMCRRIVKHGEESGEDMAYVFDLPEQSHS